MSVSASQVLTPAGLLDPAIIWPGLSPTKVAVKIAAFLVDGEARSADAEDPDASTKLWVYYRAKREQYERMNGMPSSVTDSDEGSSQYTDAQIARVLEEWKGYLAEFEDSLVETADEDSFTTLRSLR